MVSKKDPRFNLETNRKVYFQLGLFVAGTLVLMAFSWRTPVAHSFEMIAAERTSDVPLLEVLVEKDEPIVEVIERNVETTSPPNPVITEHLSTTDNTNQNETVGVSTDPLDAVEVNFGEVPIGPAPDLDVIVKFPEVEASFDGNWRKFLADNIVYPEQSRVFHEEGTVWVEFVVDRDGSLTNIRVNERSHRSKELREEALRVVKNSPAWNPGISGGEKVRTNARVQITFKLQ